jgi:hypothetical protein
MGSGILTEIKTGKRYNVEYDGTKKLSGVCAYVGMGVVEGVCVGWGGVGWVGDCVSVSVCLYACVCLCLCLCVCLCVVWQRERRQR